MNNKKDLKMYCITLRGLSPIQQGIQSAHAIVNYSLGDKDRSKLYEEWATWHQTMVILNGGTVNDLKRYNADLLKLGVEVIRFREPDLDNIPTAIAFIVDVKNDSVVSQYLRSMKLV